MGFVLPSFALGGSERQAFLLARHLATEEGARVVLVSLAGAGRITDLCADAGLSCKYFRLRHPGRGAVVKALDLVRFAAFLRRERIQVLLPYCMFPNVLCALTWRLGGCRACLWNQRDEGRERLSTRIERLAVRQVRCFVSNSQHGADFLRTTLKVSAETVHVVHNGVELAAPLRTGTSWRAALGIDRDAFVACMVANLHRYKDHETLVAAWRHVVERLQRHGTRAHLVLAGAYRDRYQALADQVRELYLESSVHFLGEVNDVSGILQAADLAVFSSQAEGLPNAVLEAMAAGLAVAGTDYPGIREALGLSGSQLLAPAGDAGGLAERIITAALDPALRHRLGLLARGRAESEFTVDQMCRRMSSRIAGELPGTARAIPSALAWLPRGRGADRS